MDGKRPEDVEPGEGAPRPEPEVWRTIYFGQIAQPLVPAPEDPTQTPDEALEGEALADPGEAPEERPPSSAWRAVAVVAVAVVALGIVFWWAR